MASSSQASKPLSHAGLILAAAGFAAAELALGLTVGGFFHGQRAEPLLFLAFRPWLLLLAAALVARYPARQRALFFLIALGLAAACETLLMLALDAASTWRWALRGLAAGGLLALALDFIFSSGRRFFGPKGVIGMSLPLLAIFLYPGGLRGYEAVALGSRVHAPAGGPDLLLMTDLPIIWGDKGAFDPASRPAAAYAMLRREFSVTPLDVIDEGKLARARLMLLAQPRALAPEELVALDGWVRRGGRLLILTDPALLWPSELPLGDLRRPPPVGLLAPLLTHWRLRLEPPADPSLVAADLETGGISRRLILAAPGRLVPEGEDCAALQPWLARCRIGAGEAMILADADLLRDDLWVGAGDKGRQRHHRLSDNVVAVADLLDGLAGIDRGPARGRVDWLPLRPDRTGAILAALLPLVLAGLSAALLRHRS